MGEVAAAYAGCRERVGALVKDLDEQRASAEVATCPEWTVHNVAAHLAGVVDDALAGRLDGVATEPWTAAQVDARRSMTVAQIMEEWDSKAPAFESILDAIGDPGRQVVADAVTHEHDIRLGLHQPGARETDAVRIGVGFVVHGFLSTAANRGTGIRVLTTDGEAFGDESAALVLQADAFEVLRALTGRRSIDQLREMKWQGDVDTALPAFTFGPFRPAARRIEE